MLFRSIGAMMAAIIVVLVATPIIKKFAIKIGAVDQPNHRRINKIPVANIGGLAIFLGFWIAVFLFGEVGQTTLWMFIGSSVILLTGLVDDIFDLSPFIKLFIQLSVAAFVVILADVRIDFFRIPFNGKYIMLGSFAIPLTVLWITGITNAINFIDGLDGLAAGTAGIAATTLMVVAIEQGYSGIAIMLIALAASAFAFLKYNSNPAQIFMGDTGSMTLGFLLAIMSIEGLMKSATTIAIIVPFLALGLPILDSTFSIVRRLSNGKSPFSADRGHLHHRLIDRGCDQKLAVRILYTVSVFSGGIALIFVLGFNLISLVSSLFVTGFILATFSQFRALQKENK
jgi:UDP-GlcNAc:undecaprenyl-phosphate GlcNAc-1-phosphate transferase